MTLSAAKSKTYELYAIATLGGHILAQRKERGLLQREVAARIGVSEETIHHWETSKTEPEVRHWPTIMDFLGYCPCQEVKTWGDRLRLNRTHRGLSHRQLAQIIGCDPGSLSRWETGERVPTIKFRTKVESFFRSE